MPLVKAMLFVRSLIALKCAFILVYLVLAEQAVAQDAFVTEGAQSTTLTFGIVPQQSAKRLAATWGPLIKRLSDETGLDIRFATATNIPTFEARLVQNSYDIAYMNPYHYAVFSKQSGYKAIAKQTNKQIKGIIVVKKDSPIEKLSDLEGKRVAFPAPLAFAATLIPQALLKREGLSIQPKYVQSHDSVYLNVSKGFFEAGGGIIRTLNNAPSEVQEQLRVLYTSDGYTPHAIAISPNLSPQIAQRVKQALLSIDDQSLLEAIGFSGFSEAADADWDGIRDLDIKIEAQP